MLAALAPGASTVELPNRGEDVLATRDAVAALGARVDDRGKAIVVEGGRLLDPASTIDARNSGTTVRLLLGLCAGHGISARFDGDDSLRRRPMERVAKPLRAVGANVETSDGRLPAVVRGVMNPPGGEFALEIPSAQVKSAILLANLAATGPVRITGDRHSRDHTERMLRHLGRDIAFDGRTIELRPGSLKAGRIRIPADLSGAAFFIVAAAITPGSELLLLEVGVNPTRTGFLDVMRAMGADIVLEHERDLDGEPVADLRVHYHPLQAAAIDGDLVVRAIDEIPILAVAAAHATGTTRVRDAAESRERIRSHCGHCHHPSRLRRRRGGASRRIRRDRRGRAASGSAAGDTWRSSHRDGDRSARGADRAAYHRRCPLQRRELPRLLRTLENRPELRLVLPSRSQDHRARQLRREV